MDIVERLRLRPEREMLYLDGCVSAGYGPTIEAQAADEIERLRADLSAARAEVEKLKEDLAAERALVNIYADNVDALRPVLPPFGAANGTAWYEAVREQAKDGPIVVRADGSSCTMRQWAQEMKTERDSLCAQLAAARAALQKFVDAYGTYDVKTWMQVRDNAIAVLSAQYSDDCASKMLQADIDLLRRIEAALAKGV